MTGSLAVRYGVAVLALAGGAAFGCAAVGLHRYPWGLVLALAAVAAALVALPGGWWRRLPFAVGWVLTVLWLARERPEGDLLVTSNTSGYLLLVAGLVVLVCGLVGVRERPVVHRADAGENATTS
ncbi:DUF6113 family protein [Nocardioides stalactiti]|uniref:DUF6113 family protein n=1 Tax=Nocardioides stalactiti TaxID=2755356 RepID=UPI0016004FE9|nr:DUF6113 family protein [Nocardioides stalactiti]